MPIPDNPQTRQEMFLNAMATGDSSGIPESPQTREEMYLDAIVKNGSGGGGGDMFVTLGTISAATVPMIYDEDEQAWVGDINTDITATSEGACAGRNLALKINGQLYSVELVQPNASVDIGETETTVYLRAWADEQVVLFLNDYGSDAPVITDLSMEVYAPTPELAIFFSSNPK